MSLDPSDLPAGNQPELVAVNCKVALVDLDGYPVPDWVPERLAREGIELTMRDCKTRDELAEHAADAEVVWLFGGSRILTEGNLAAVPRCWAIVRTGSGTDNIPLEEATRRGIVVANTPAAFSDPVSDHVIALLFHLVRGVGGGDRAVRRGRWEQSTAQPLNSLQGQTLGLVGFGRIPRAIVQKLTGFAMKVLAYDPHVAAETLASHGVRPVSLEDLLAESDFVSLHCPLAAETRHLIGERELRSMKPTAILLNTSRGPVVDEKALVRALQNGWIRAAGLDVLEQEPPAPDNPLLHMDNVVVTPHSAGLAASGAQPRWQLSVETILALSQGRWPASCVNPDVQPARQLRVERRG